ncbi:MAG: hypothetical protein WAT23_18460 [Chromatiaceae bacterium]
MKKTDMNQEDELRPEYDLKSLPIRKFGPSRAHLPPHGVILESDVAPFFPDSASVNEALRFLVRATQDSSQHPRPIATP